LLGPMRLTAALLPHLLAKLRATIMTVSSQLKSSGVEVLELILPVCKLI
jgi:hypothetical protein